MVNRAVRVKALPLRSNKWIFNNVLLARSLLYTAITRAKKLAVILGSERALRRAARTQRSGRAW